MKDIMLCWLVCRNAAKGQNVGKGLYYFSVGDWPGFEPTGKQSTTVGKSDVQKLPMAKEFIMLLQ